VELIPLFGKFKPKGRTGRFEWHSPRNGLFGLGRYVIHSKFSLDESKYAVNSPGGVSIYERNRE